VETPAAGPPNSGAAFLAFLAIQLAALFGFRAYTAAWRKGLEWATIQVIIADGAGLHFTGANQIVDLYRTRQHLWYAAALLHPLDPAAKKLWMTLMEERERDPVA
jgi:hypothetical protein